ncbi:MAG: hypothetical protein LBK60_00940 [Verrucomicrobiales bacterium]|jgi:hypothetical protein|nr:hypothetical protein [Verrucomicrobiales bacterium]
MQTGSVQIGWALAVTVALGLLMPWVRFAPASAFDDQSAIVAQLAEDDWLRDYALMNGHDWRALRRNLAAGESGLQVALAGREPESAARALAELLFGGTLVWNKALLVAPLLAAAGAVALMHRKRTRRWLVALAVAQAALYFYLRWQLRAGYVDRLALELNWGVWLMLYGLLLMALLLTARALLPPRVKW